MQALGPSCRIRHDANSADTPKAVITTASGFQPSTKRSRRRNSPRKEIHRPLDHLRLLRNRIAHHEPIFRRHIEADYETLLRVIGWMSPETANWGEHHATVREIFAQRPEAAFR